MLGVSMNRNTNVSEDAFMQMYCASCFDDCVKEADLKTFREMFEKTVGIDLAQEIDAKVGKLIAFVVAFDELDAETGRQYSSVPSNNDGYNVVFDEIVESVSMKPMEKLPYKGLPKYRGSLDNAVQNVLYCVLAYFASDVTKTVMQLPIFRMISPQPLIRYRMIISFVIGVIAASRLQNDMVSQTVALVSGGLLRMERTNKKVVTRQPNAKVIFERKSHLPVAGIAKIDADTYRTEPNGEMRGALLSERKLTSAEQQGLGMTFSTSFRQPFEFGNFTMPKQIFVYLPSTSDVVENEKIAYTTYSSRVLFLALFALGAYGLVSKDVVQNQFHNNWTSATDLTVLSNHGELQKMTNFDMNPITGNATGLAQPLAIPSPVPDEDLGKLQPPLTLLDAL